MSRVDRAHMTFDSTFIDTIRLSCNIFETEQVIFQKWQFFLPHMYRVSPKNLHHEVLLKFLPDG